MKDHTTSAQQQQGTETKTAVVSSPVDLEQHYITLGLNVSPFNYVCVSVSLCVCNMFTPKQSNKKSAWIEFQVQTLNWRNVLLWLNNSFYLINHTPVAVGTTFNFLVSLVELRRTLWSFNQAVGSQKQHLQYWPDEGKVKLRLELLSLVFLKRWAVFQGRINLEAGKMTVYFKL